VQNRGIARRPRCPAPPSPHAPDPLICHSKCRCQTSVRHPQHIPLPLYHTVSTRTSEKKRARAVQGACQPPPPICVYSNSKCSLPVSVSPQYPPPILSYRTLVAGIVCPGRPTHGPFDYISNGATSGRLFDATLPTYRS
jgi:hypothetical protein